VRSEADVAGLNRIRAEDDLGYVMRAVSTIRRELAGSVPLIGFSGSPWTLATYMVEGGSSREFTHVKSMAYDRPALMHQLLALLADAVADYLLAQVRAGAQALQIFDTWGGSLSAAGYREFSLHYMQQVITRLPTEAEGRKVPVIVFTKGGGQWLDAIAGCGAHCVGIDWTTDMHTARVQVGDRVALQGNMDPAMLYASPARIRGEVAAILAAYGHGSGHVFNLGHGITPGVHPDNVTAFVDAVQELSPQYHTAL
jgi:uroporphyrinogen decarboxylase